MEKDSIFNMWCWENCTTICKGIKLGYSLITYIKIKMDQRPKYKPLYYKTLRVKYR